VCNALRLNDIVRNTAAEIHRTLLALKESTGGFRGDHFKLSAASAAYYACMIHRVSRGEVEFSANIPEVARRRLTTMNKNVRRMLQGSPFAAMLHTPINPKHLIPRFIGALAVSPSIIDSAANTTLRKYMEDVFDNERVAVMIEGRTPECTCAAVAVLGIEHLQGAESDRLEVAKRCGVSVASINTIVNVLQKVV
jgi:transcription initiation factor TFIIIB Brf1 subunit/transcription initiation factor TFIIB